MVFRKRQEERGERKGAEEAFGREGLCEELGKRVSWQREQQV